MADTRRRVKLYMLNEDRQWDDRGTGHVSSAYVERLRGMSLLVRSETDGSILLESKIQQDTAYQKQQETLIVWSEADNYDLALSFQEKAGCDEIWEKICQVQGKDPSVDITQDVVEESEDERFDDMPDAAPPIELPPCETSKLEEIAELFSSVLPSPIRREKLAVAIEAESYIRKLVDLFHMCEDLENIDGLHHLYEIFKSIFLLNKNALFEIMFSDDIIFDIIGILEYDPTSPTPTKHREYLRNTAKFKEVVPMTNSELETKIHQTYRVQYIQDVILPTPSVFEENMLSSLSSFIFFNKVEIVSMIQDDVKFLTTLFAQLTGEETDDNHRRDLVLFLKEFCTFSQTLQQPNRESFYKTLSNLGILSSIEIILGLDDEKMKLAAIDIFSYIVEFSPSMVREFILHESISVDDEDLLINLVIEQMINDTDPELGGAVQLIGILRLLLDPENMLATASKTEKSEFLSFFYKHSMHVLTAPLFANTADNKPSRDDYQSAQLLGLILELLTFCVEHHTYHIKNYIITKDVLRRVLVLLKSRHSFLVLCALRFCRKIIGLKEEFYNRYIIKENLFRPIVDAFLANGDRYNLINSAMIELFEFIKVEDIKSLSTYIVETFQKDLEGIKYVKTFETLKIRYDQQRDRSRDKHSFESSLKKVSPIKLKKTSGKRKWSDFQVLPEIEDADEENSDRHAASIVRNNRFRRDARAPDEDEEMWFSQDDENEENDSTPQVSELLKNKIDSDLEHIHKLWENKKTKDNQLDVETPPRLLSGTKSAINISIKTGSNSSLSSLLSMPDSPGSPGGSPPAPNSPESPCSPPTSPHSPGRLCPTPHVSPVSVHASKGSTGSNAGSLTAITTTSTTTTASRITDSPPSNNVVTTKAPGLKGLVDYPDEDSEEEEEDEEEDVIAPSPKRPRVGT
ncbi:serine/threonine-protein phosphatase 4 regulatory subunit 3A-like isoform X1 [Biomphalaria glabrata]|uniref:Serine/threonine-protein phosphatase 4 regulatory subunit 3A-like isoform X1 n=1 Tax=Biomphalaria glabrata TaxID=6526 RepID=A0A9W2ZYD8_BIOGL|nr:serine/threonine-protein phosphatase 4 regulatory subunit 3A-like isoform X1 [Biomphalaria glabrata]